MKQLYIYKYFSAITLLISLTSNVNADYVENRNHCYECTKNPITPYLPDFQIQAGIVPVAWRNRGFVFGTNVDILSSPSSPFFQIPHFNDLYKMPWIVGGQVGWGLDCNTRVFVEFNYAQSCGHCPVVPTFSRTLGLSASKYKFYDGYSGIRYYTDRICNRTSFFIGVKVGFIHHEAVNFNATIISTIPFTILVPATPITPLFLKNTVVSGGGHIGTDICLWGGFSLVITGEVVASRGPKGNPLIGINPAVLGVNSLLIHDVGTELRFPVTAGLRYSF